MLATEHTESFQATEFGFQAVVDGNLRQYQDSDVVGLKVRNEQRGTLCHERLDIRVRDRQVLVVSNDYPPGQINLLEPLRDRLLDELVASSAEKMQSGEEIGGAGWTMNRERFRCDQAGSIPLEQIGAAAWLGDEFCLWRTDADQPFARFPAEAENAILLQRLTQLLVKDAPVPADAAARADGPGELIAEFRDASPAAQAWAAGIGIIGGLTVLLTLNLGLDGAPSLLAVAAFAAVATAVGVGFVLTQNKNKHALQHFSHQLVLEKGGDERVEIPFDDLHSFSTHWTDHYYNHAYTGTSVRLAFIRNGDAKPTIEHQTSTKRGADKYAQLEALQAQCSALIAERMRAELEQNGRVVWTDKLTILPEGLEYTKRAGNEPELIPYYRVSKLEAKNGQLKIWLDGNWTATIVQPANAPNFNPGMVLMQAMEAAGRDAAIQAKVEMAAELNMQESAAPKASEA